MDIGLGIGIDSGHVHRSRKIPVRILLDERSDVSRQPTTLSDSGILKGNSHRFERLIVLALSLEIQSPLSVHRDPLRSQ